MLEIIRFDDIEVETDTGDFESYDVKILEKSSLFKINDIMLKSKYTALVTFRGKGFQRKIEYAAISKKKIYRLIERNVSIRLENVYIKSFSISEYKEQRQLDKYEDITLKSFDAEQCFFDKGFDLSMTEILSNSSKYNDTIFAGGFIDFRITYFKGIDT